MESFAGTPILAPSPGNPVPSAPIAAPNPGSFPGDPIFSGAPITALSPSSVTLADDRPPQVIDNTETIQLKKIFILSKKFEI